MTKPQTLKSLLLTLGGALLATACTVTLDPSGGDGGSEEECLELFETCVELAGDSPGCDAVFEFCSGAGGEDGGDDGGDDGGPGPGCEEEYIDCLAEIGDPDQCEPLLWECGGGDGGEEGGDEGGCDPDDPECDPCADGSCEPTNCDEQFQICVDLVGEDSDACHQLLDACWTGDCSYMLASCAETGIADISCEELTGCYDDPPPCDADEDGDCEPTNECDQLLADCVAETGDQEFCLNQYPECFDPDPTGEPGGECQWYEEECYGQFSDEFCWDAQNACQVGVLPDHFECHYIFPDACQDISDEACAQAEEACWNGFHDVMLCGSIADDPAYFVQELALCNGWE